MGRFIKSITTQTAHKHKQNELYDHGMNKANSKVSAESPNITLNALKLHKLTEWMEAMTKICVKHAGFYENAAA